MHEYFKTLIKKGVALVIMVLQDTYSYFYSWQFNLAEQTELILKRTSTQLVRWLEADLPMQTMRMIF